MNTPGRIVLQLVLAFAFGVGTTLMTCQILNRDFDALLFVSMFTIGIGLMIGWRVIEYFVHKQYHYVPNKIVKIGLDIHGMIDYDPIFFSELSRVLVYGGHEVHIMTGSHITPDIEKELKGYGMSWTKLFSIADYYKAKPGIKVIYDAKGRPWVEPELWNMAKADYAKLHDLDLTLDDTSDYMPYFSTSIGICKIVNKAKKIRGPKAVMPDEMNNVTPINNTVPSNVQNQKP